MCSKATLGPPVGRRRGPDRFWRAPNMAIVPTSPATHSGQARGREEPVATVARRRSSRSRSSRCAMR
jgi:hypothetical protein